jgi:hypothetical protein
MEKIGGGGMRGRPRKLTSGFIAEVRRLSRQGVNGYRIIARMLEEEARRWFVQYIRDGGAMPDPPSVPILTYGGETGATWGGGSEWGARVNLSEQQWQEASDRVMRRWSFLWFTFITREQVREVLHPRRERKRATSHQPPTTPTDVRRDAPKDKELH